MKTIITCILVICSFFGRAQTNVNFYTNKGNFTVEVREDLMPITAGNFIKLVDSGFYDGLIFHRVVKDFVIQGGDPTGTGFGGPGYTLQNEYHPSLNHDSAGVLAMANNGMNTAGSQFYFTLSAQNRLDGDYAVFGTCIKGLDKIMAIGEVNTDTRDKPLVAVVMDSLRTDSSKSVQTYFPFGKLKTEVYPNPFNSHFHVSYELTQQEQVHIHFFNAHGQVLQVFENELKPKGIHTFSSAEHHLGELANGIYYLGITSPSGAARVKLLKLK